MSTTSQSDTLKRGTLDDKTPTPAPVRTRASAALMSAVLLLSASGLMFELVLTRIFSATIWYHYAFIAISVALFGWGLGGFLVYILRLGQRPNLRALLPFLAMLPGVLMPIFLATILQFKFEKELLTFYFMMSLLPFLAGGAALSLVFETYGSDSNRLYFADLSGAALGVLGVRLVIPLFGAETTVLATGILPALAAVLLVWAIDKAHRPKILPILTVLILVANIGLTAWNRHMAPSGGGLTIRDAPTKALYQFLAEYRAKEAKRFFPENQRVRIEFDRWNTYSRITAVRSPLADNLARIFIDSDNWTNIMRWDGTRESLKDKRDLFRAFPFRVSPTPNVMIIGPGGGTDVVLALGAGSPSVTAVEMNPLMIQAVRGFGQEAGNLYDHPNVRLVMNEGRNFTERTSEKYDVIMLGFVDTFAAVSSGGLSLSENYLYTSEALEAYYNHLTDIGVLAIIRWPEDVPRLTANATEFLSARGMSMHDIGNHVMAVSERKPTMVQIQGYARPVLEPVQTVFLLSRSPMTREFVDNLLEKQKDPYIVHAPSRPSAPETPQYDRLFSGQISFAHYTDSFDTLATPVKDDRPFYFANDKPWGMPNFIIKLFSIPVVAVLIFSVALLIGGLFLGVRPPGARPIFYFGALGLGFIVCEIALMQRLILLLGHPLYTLVVILFTILLASSLGSLYARRFAPEQIHHKLGWIIVSVIVLMAVASVALPPILRTALPLTLSLRIALGAAIVFPFGFLMGMPFPLGLRRMALDPKAAPVSALWGINGVASVVGSISCIALAVFGGFTWVFAAGAMCYAVAWLTRPR
jgi:hypothetical protein